MTLLMKCPLKFWKQLCHNKIFLNKQYNLYSSSLTKTLIKCRVVHVDHIIDLHLFRSQAATVFKKSIVFTFLMYM